TDGFTHAGEAGISAPRHLYRRPRFVRRMNRRAAPRVRFTVIRTVFAFLATFPTQRTVMSRPAQRRRSLPLLILTILALLTTGATPASAAASTLTLDHATYTPGQNVVATYSTGQVSAKNWVGIYASDSTPGQVSSLVWAYAPDASGSVTLSTSSLNPGSYRAHFLYNDGYTDLTPSIFFTVLSTTSTSTPNSALCTGQTSYAQGQALLASYATTRVSATNWIGVYAAGQQPGSTNALVWAYAPNATGSASLS